MSENGSRDEYLLKRVESIIIGEIELLENVLPGETCQWNDNVQVVEDELVLKVCKI